MFKELNPLLHSELRLGIMSILLVLHHILPRIHCNAGNAWLPLKQGGKETCSRNLTLYYTVNSVLA